VLERILGRRDPEGGRGGDFLVREKEAARLSAALRALAAPGLCGRSPLAEDRAGQSGKEDAPGCGSRGHQGSPLCISRRRRGSLP